MRVAIVLVLLFLAAPTNAEPRTASTSSTPDFYLAPYVRGFAPLHGVQDVGSGWAVGAMAGYWSRRLRVGYAMDFGEGACAACPSDSSSWTTFTFGGDVSFDMLRMGSWSLVGSARPRVMLAGTPRESGPVPPPHWLFEPQVALAVWQDFTSERLRQRAMRTAWFVELQAEEWLHGHDSSPAFGLALGLAFGGCC